MSAENEEFDISQSMAAELTGSIGVPENATADDMLPNDLAEAVEAQERHIAEKDLQVNNDVDDTREAEQEQTQQRGKKVPLAALHEERTRRQQAEAQLQVQAQQLQQLLAQQQAVQQAQLQAQQDAAIPDFDEDPRGYIEAKERQFAQQLEQLQNGPAQQHQQIEVVRAQLHQEAAAVAPSIIEAEARFAAANPDYPQAFEVVQANADAALRQMYPGATEAEFQLVRNAAMVEFGRGCAATGANPAEKIYAKARELGFKAASRQPRKEPPTSLSNMHGSARAPDEKGAISASDISSMTEAEFDKFWAGMRRDSVVGPKF